MGALLFTLLVARNQFVVTHVSAVSPTSWIEAPKEHKLGLCDGKIVCLNTKGKQLAAVPPWLKEESVFEQLQALTTWLDEHATECLHTVEHWMLRSLILPRETIIKTWPDMAWRSTLENMVIAAADKSGKIDFDRVGLLRNVDAKRGLGIVDLDGESKWLERIVRFVETRITERFCGSEWSSCEVS